MTTTAVANLPKTGDPTAWTPQELALMEFAGLTWLDGPEGNKQRFYAPRSVVEAFSATVARTGLDPVARQIYAVLIGGKWSIIIGIDGMRVVAQRTGEYLGQTPMQWTADGVTWVDVWLDPKNAPAAARVGIRRKGFAEPLVSVVTWAEFGKTSGQWSKMPAHMLGIRCESHALRRAFPNDLSGLYTIEDIDGGEIPAEAVVPTRDWIAEVRATTDKADLERVTYEIRGYELDADGVPVLDDEGNPKQAEGRSSEMTGDLRQVILTHAATLTRDSRPKKDLTPEEEAALAYGRDEAAIAEAARREFEGGEPA